MLLDKKDYTIYLEDNVINKYLKKYTKRQLLSLIAEMQWQIHKLQIEISKRNIIDNMIEYFERIK